MKILRSLLILATSISLAPLALAAEDGFVALFDGKTLDGWEQHSGKAEYRVEDGAIVGKTVAGTGNSFLCSKLKYADFVFECEFKVAPTMNSGVQFRSEINGAASETEINGKKVKRDADRVFGYQFEIDPSARSYTGGVYDEARRGWLADLKDNEAARKAFKQGEWNAIRIECKGESIKTFVNGVAAADIKDGMTKEGILGLQVHGIGKKTENAGQEIRWRNIRIKEIK